jgi:hypothetical protein
MGPIKLKFLLWTNHFLLLIYYLFIHCLFVADLTTLLVMIMNMTYTVEALFYTSEGTKSNIYKMN